MFPVAILAGGLATRLRPISESIPKSMIEINNKPFIDWQLSLLSRRGITKVILCLSYKSQSIQKYVGDGSKFNLNVEYSFDGADQLGTGGAIKNALDLLGDKFMVLYGDSFLELDYLQAQKSFETCGKSAMMTIYENKNLFEKSNVKVKSLSSISYSKDKIDLENNYVDFGLTFFESTVFRSDKYKSKFELSDLCRDLSVNNQLAGFEVYNRFFEVGSFEGINDLANYLKGGQSVF
jgi:NDP-sugar pyrophosphorylase family protein